MEIVKFCLGRKEHANEEGQILIIFHRYVITRALYFYLSRGECQSR